MNITKARLGAESATTASIASTVSRRWCLASALVILGCSAEPEPEPDAGNNGESSFQCGPRSDDPDAPCRGEPWLFQTPSNVWCQGYKGKHYAELEPVPDDQAEDWRCIECLTDEECVDGWECAVGQCASPAPPPTFECGPFSNLPDPDCAKQSFETPENGWCQAYVTPPDSDRQPVSNFEPADYWRCIECLADEECKEGSECKEGVCNLPGE